jgi:hypothetical protein
VKVTTTDQTIYRALYLEFQRMASGLDSRHREAFDIVFAEGLLSIDCAKAGLELLRRALDRQDHSLSLNAVRPSCAPIDDRWTGA